MRQGWTANKLWEDKGWKVMSIGIYSAGLVTLKSNALQLLVTFTKK